MFENRERKGYLGIFLISLVTSLSVGILMLAFLLNYDKYNITNPQLPPFRSDSEAVPQQPQMLSLDDAGGRKTAENSENRTVFVAASVAKSASPGVVGISVLKVGSGAAFDRNAAENWGLGSGVIVSPDGYILTNHHVAGGRNKRIIVTLADGRNVDGVTLWSDPVLDLAVVKINVTGLPTIPFGDSDALQVGEPAIAIGNPLGMQFQRTVTSGIISALNRTIQIETENGINYMEDLIQTDASINPGNSGGPLLNSKGQVVGINTVKVTGAEAIGFAVPANVAVPIIKHYVEEGEFIEPYLGIFAYDKEVVPAIDGNLKFDKGVYVVHVDENGPAYKSGIRVGCNITQVDGKDVNTMMQLRTYLYSKKPGDIIKINHISNGKAEVVEVKLAAKERDGILTR